MSTIQHRPEIDGLRAIAVLPVVLFHADFQAFAGGFVGVDVFFVVSGYLITSIILAEQQSGTFTLASFYERRARRILPALMVVVLACLPFAWVLMLPHQMREFSESVAGVGLFLSNFVFWRQGGYFGAAAELKPLLHTWSLAVEEQYYIVFPLLLIALRKANRRNVAALLFVAAMTSLALAEFAARRHGTAHFFLTLPRIWEILVGALCAYRLALSPQPAWRPPAGLDALGLALILLAVAVLDRDSPYPGVLALLPTLGAALIILFAGPETLVGRLLSIRLLVWIGLISYSVYLWHQPVFAFARLATDGELGAVSLLGLSAASLALGYLSWRFVERPFRDRRNFSRNTVFALAGLACAAIATTGASGVATEGFLFRFPAGDRNLLVALDTDRNRDYVTARFDAVLNRPFEPGVSPKVTVVGDSFAQDFVNVLVEGAFVSPTQISSRYISAQCQMSYPVDHEFPNSPPSLVEFCRYSDDLEKAAPQLRASDVVVFAAAWDVSTLASIGGSIERLGFRETTQVIVVARKWLGELDPRSFLGTTPEERAATRVAIDASTAQENASLAASLPGNVVFVDPMASFCGNDGCRLFDDDGNLLSHDGGHLTVFGARFLGASLRQEKTFEDLW